MTEIVLQPRNKIIADLVQQCADGKLPFDGPNSLWSQVREMGYSCNSLYEMVLAAEMSLEHKQQTGFATRQDEETDEACKRNRE